MYLRHTIRKKDRKVHRYWCLVRSVRVGRRVIQQTVAHLGELDEQGRVEARSLARRVIGRPEPRPLFSIASASSCPSACASPGPNCKLSHAAPEAVVTPKM